MKKTVLFGLLLAASLPLLTACEHNEQSSGEPLPVIQPLVDTITGFFSGTSSEEETPSVQEVSEKSDSENIEDEALASTPDQTQDDTSEISGGEEANTDFVSDADQENTESDVAASSEEPAVEESTSEPVEETPAVAAVPPTNTQAHPYMPPMPYGSAPAMPPMANGMAPMMPMNPMMMNPGMMNPGMMNPGAMNYAPMYPMGMMGGMNPQYHAMWMQAMMRMAANPTIDGMTQPQNMQAMMMAMNPQMMAAMMGGQANPNAEVDEDGVPQQLPLMSIPGFPTQTPQSYPDRTVVGEVSAEAKKNAFQTMMMVSPLSMRDMLGIMTDKMPLEEGVSWEDAVDSMKLRANEKNFKFVGSNPLYKQVEAMTGEPTGKVEIFQFCDALVADKIVAEVPEFIVFLPCRIALIEDADGKLWVMTMDWDVSWLDFAQNQNSHLGKELRADATRIRETLRYIMEGAATGDF